MKSAIGGIVMICICIGSATAAFAQSCDLASIVDIPAACRTLHGMTALSQALSAIADATQHKEQASPVNRDELFACEIIARDLAEIDLARQEIRTSKDAAAKDIARALIQAREKESSTLAARFTTASY